MLRDTPEAYSGPAPGCHQHDAGAAGGTQPTHRRTESSEVNQLQHVTREAKAGLPGPSFQTVTRSTGETNGITCHVAQGQWQRSRSVLELWEAHRLVPSAKPAQQEREAGHLLPATPRRGIRPTSATF